MKINKLFNLVCVSGALILASCSSDDDNEQGGPVDSVLNIPTLEQVITDNDFTRADNGDYNNDFINNYSTLFTREGNSTVSFSGQTTRLKQAVEIGGNLKSQVDVAAIRLKFEGQDGESAGFTDTSLNGTTKIVRSKTSSSIALFAGSNGSGQGQTNVNAIDAYITGHQNVLENWMTAAASGQAGVFEDTGDDVDRYVDAKGRELDQLFTKSLAGALAYDQAVNHYLNRLDNENGDTSNGDYRALNDAGTVAEGKNYTTMEHHWDEAFGYIYGNTSSQNLIYKYIDNVDGLSKFSGTEREIFAAFVAGRIAIAEKDYTVRDTQVGILREKLGLIIAVRAVHYLSAGAKIIEAAEAASGATGKRENAFHDLCEGYGFVNSLRYVVNANGDRYFTDADVDGFLTTLDSGSGLWDVTTTELRDMADAIAAEGVGGLSWTLDDVNP
ncbi:DUF4856 domain-containing protein [Aquimarina algicola]|uniref:DUF4856 domain-containing protein n=1 Tax=Aquimarina algicola TaxID=2589995 RepID=A0A504J4G1_9FLAO|nr:DUF4856 domain-containing protein [Aquimarina algicola]TPN85374.1 DUF4856 domain-containing protein [Aquimarina algicola]